VKNISWKLVLVFVVVIAAVIYILPTLKIDIWPHKKINLGLDLQGGMHLVLEVDSNKAVESTAERISQEIREELKKNRLRNIVVNPSQATQISIQVKSADNVDEFKELLDNDFRDLRQISENADGGAAYSIVLGLTETDQDQIKKLAVDQALETIRNRIDQFGVAEPDIRRQGENRILIQLPGIKDTQRAKDLIGKTALLEFKLVDDTASVDAAVKGDVPPGREVLYRVELNPETQRTTNAICPQKADLADGRLSDGRPGRY
jgi:preprotein translocase subunit SecD